MRTQPSKSIKGELNNAVLCGIRQRGPEAMGLLMVGMAKLILVAVTLAVLLGVATLFGCDPNGILLRLI